MRRRSRVAGDAALSVFLRLSPFLFFSSGRRRRRFLLLLCHPPCVTVWPLRCVHPGVWDSCRYPSRPAARSVWWSALASPPLPNARAGRGPPATRWPFPSLSLDPARPKHPHRPPDSTSAYRLASSLSSFLSPCSDSPLDGGYRWPFLGYFFVPPAQWCLFARICSDLSAPCPPTPLIYPARDVSLERQRPGLPQPPP